MKAAFLETTGGPEVIRYGDVPTPAPKTGEVLVRVAAASLNPIDTYIRSGMVNMPLPKPFIPGCDLAGTVHTIGAGVKTCRVGERVWGSNQGLLGRQGTFAEYACVQEDWLYQIPDGVSEQDAAAVALVGITAHLGLFRCARLQPGETVFVNGGTGGVGSMVVQEAKAAGAKVITTVGSDAKADMCRKWGADGVLNYKTDDIPSRIRDFTSGKGVNVWYETQREPNFQQTVELLAKRGRMIVMAGRQAQPIFPVGPFYVKDLSLFGFAMFNASPDEQRECAKDINRWLSEKKLQVPIGRTFKFSEAAAAHRFLEENTLHKAGTLTGKIVLVPD
jgi:NADPH2:quinone reductase